MMPPIERKQARHMQQRQVIGLKPQYEDIQQRSCKDRLGNYSEDSNLSQTDVGYCRDVEWTLRHEKRFGSVS
jgi:hypothetical protein